MTHWKETARIARHLAEIDATGRRAALATVVRIAGSSYRRPGAKLLVVEGGRGLGSVSGGCLEADVREVAAATLETGRPCLRHYDTGTHEDIVWGLGLGCNGEVDVFIQPASEGPFSRLASSLSTLLSGDTPFALATVVESAGDLGIEGETSLFANGKASSSLGSAALDAAIAARFGSLLVAGRSELSTIAGTAVFFEVLRPPPHLLICGAGDDTQPLAAYAADAGFRVTVLDHRPALLQAERFAPGINLVFARPQDDDLALPPADRSFAVIKTHSLAQDREWARRFLAAGLPFIGLLGPRARARGLRQELGAAGHERIVGPVGLDLGSEGPHQIAISIVAQLLAFHAGRQPLPLDARAEAIHAG